MTKARSNATAPNAKGTLVVGNGTDASTTLAVASTAGYVLTVDSAEATGLKWAAASSPSFVGCRLLNSANQTISNNTWTAVTFNTETFDTDGFHSTTTNTSRVTIPSGKAGKYLLIGNASWNSANATGRRAMQIYKNGTALNGSRFECSPTSTSFPNHTVSIIMDGTVGDYFEVFVIQTSGGNMDIYGDDSSFHVQYLGA